MSNKETLEFVVKYLDTLDTRDKICRAIQFGSKFLSNGEPGTAQTVEQTTSLARKVFRLFKFVNNVNEIWPKEKKEAQSENSWIDFLVIVFDTLKNVFMGIFFFLDQFVWLGITGIYQNKEETEYVKTISLCFMLGGFICTTVAEMGRLGVKKDKEKNEALEDILEYKQTKLEKYLPPVKGGTDVCVAVGLLELAPEVIDRRLTGLLGLITSLMSCYQNMGSLKKKIQVEKVKEKLLNEGLKKSKSKTS